MDDGDALESLRREVAARRSKLAELEEAVTRAERRARSLERIVATVPGIVWESEGTLGEPNYRITYVGGQLERILGYSPEEWRTRPDLWVSILHPDEAADVTREALRGGRPREHRFIARDGREVWVQPNVRILRDEAGARVGTSIFVMDVTERVRAARAREELHARTEALARRLDNLVASVPGLVWESRPIADGKSHAPVFSSDYLSIMTGYTPAETVGSTAVWQKLLHPEDRERASREVSLAHENGRGTIQYRWITKDGRTIWVESHVRGVRDERGAIVGSYGVTLDITPRKLAEEERERLKDQLILAREATLLELSTPLIPISSDILVMPLIGTIDATRAARLIEALLFGVGKARARVVILDVTGARNVGAETARALSKAARAARLLGAEVVLTGVTPEVAVALVTLGEDLADITTCGTLEDGIAHAAREHRAVARRSTP